MKWSLVFSLISLIASFISLRLSGRILAQCEEAERLASGVIDEIEARRSLRAALEVARSRVVCQIEEGKS
jgi:hypothetical protein